MDLLHKMKKYLNKKLLILITALFLILAVFITVDQLKKQQETKSRAGGGNTSLILSPATDTKPIGETFNVPLILKNTIPNISGIDFTLQFDKDILELNFEPSAIFNEQLINNLDSPTGVLHYAAVNTANNTNPGSEISLGNLLIRGKTNGTGTVSFNNIQIVALGINEFLPNSNNSIGSFIIAESPTAGPLPTNTSTPEIPTSIPTESPTPTILPTSTPPPTETPVPTQTPIPTDTPAPTPEPTSTSTPISDTPVPTVTKKVGDANDDGKIDILDFNNWRNEFLDITPGKTSDFNNDGAVSILDFNLWRNAFLGL